MAARRSRRQRTHHEQLMPRNPHAQIVHRSAGTVLAAGGAAVIGTDDAAGAVKG